MKNRFKALLIPMILLAVMFSACGENRIIVNLDLDSFMPEEDRSFDYIIPPLGAFDETSPVQAVEMPPGLSEIFILDEFTLSVGIMMADSLTLGNAADLQLSVSIHIGDYAETVYDSDAFVSVTHSISVMGDGVQYEEITEDIDASEFLDLFQNHEHLYIGTRLSLSHEGGVGELGVVEGGAVINRIHTHIVGRESVF